ncbi:MAG: XdhC family protein [Alphaproteobacteria bacterium]
MQRAVLDAILAARHEKRAISLAIDLKSGAQSIVINGKIDGKLALDGAALAAIDRALADDRSGRVETEDGSLFVRVFNPPRRLIMVGAVHIAQPLAPMGALAGYAVTVVDPRGAFATAERFPGVALTDAWPDEALAALGPDRRTAIVTLTHDPKLDDPALAAALRSEAFYIGALGSKKTHAGRLARLREAGFSEAELGRIHGPVGLSIGATSPAEIAVAILAQITQALHRHPARQKAA